MSAIDDDINDATPARAVVGIPPWLPWPLAAWSWWTVPVRAERLALWRIGVALALLVDLLVNYLPETLVYYGKDGIGAPGNFDWRFQSSRMTWSLLRGVGDPTILYLSLGVWISSSLWIVGNAFAWLLWRYPRPRADRTGIALWIWLAAFVCYSSGLWSNQLGKTEISFVVWLLPLIGLSIVCLIFALDIAAHLQDDDHRIAWGRLCTALGVVCLVIGAGAALYFRGGNRNAWWARFLGSWQQDDALLWTAIFVLLTAVVMLLFGFCTRFAAILAFLLAMSFGNANSALDNAGDTIRVILLFMLMLCPCGAVWSVDSLLRRAIHPSPARTLVYVSPWPICLMLVQMIFIYFMNGMYKLAGPTWIDGESLYWVLGDVVLTRFSPYMLQIPVELGRVMTWTVLIWEVSFPLLLLWKWSRRAALFMGVLFHLGIFATMELGGFVPYALCMYLPLIPWPRERADS
jgi:hypothetical protein